jgi:hypothetical protein
MSEEHWSWKQRTVLSVNADLQATKKYTRSYCDHLDERVTALEWKVNVLGSLLFLAGAAYLFWHKTSIQTNHATIG